MNKTISAVAVFLILSGIAFGQTAMRTTTLSLPVGVTDRSINLESLTGVNGLSGGQVATILFVDKEFMYVQSASGSSATVNRGQSGSDSTAHNAGATVYVGPPGAYGSKNLSGACTEASWPVTPYININNGNMYTCTSNNWVLVGSGGGGSGTITGCGFGQILNGTVCDTNTAVIPSNVILQSGAPLYCAGSASTTATCGLTPALTAYTNGMVVNFRAGATNTTTYTLNIDGQGAKSILTSAGAALSAGDITSGRYYKLTYDGTQFLLPPSGGASAPTVSGAGTWLAPWGYGENGTQTFTANTLFCQSFVSPFAATFANISSRGTITGGAGGALAVGLYSVAGDRLAQATLSSGASFTWNFPFSITLAANTQYFACVSLENAANTLSAVSIPGGGNIYEWFPSGSQSSSYFRAGNAPTGTGGTYSLPATLGSKTTETSRKNTILIFTN